MVLHVLIARDESARPVTYDQRCVQSKSAKERESGEKRKEERRKETRNDESRSIGSRRGNSRERKKWARTTQLEEGHKRFLYDFTSMLVKRFSRPFFIYTVYKYIYTRVYSRYDET